MSAQPPIKRKNPPDDKDAASPKPKKRGRTDPVLNTAPDKKQTQDNVAANKVGDKKETKEFDDNNLQKVISAGNPKDIQKFIIDHFYKNRFNTIKSFFAKNLKEGNKKYRAMRLKTSDQRELLQELYPFDEQIIKHINDSIESVSGQIKSMLANHDPNENFDAILNTLLNELQNRINKLIDGNQYLSKGYSKKVPADVILAKYATIICDSVHDLIKKEIILNYKVTTGATQNSNMSPNSPASKPSNPSILDLILKKAKEVHSNLVTSKDKNKDYSGKRRTVFGTCLSLISGIALTGAEKNLIDEKVKNDQNCKAEFDNHIINNEPKVKRKIKTKCACDVLPMLIQMKVIKKQSKKEKKNDADSNKFGIVISMGDETVEDVHQDPSFFQAGSTQRPVTYASPGRQRPQTPVTQTPLYQTDPSFTFTATLGTNDEITLDIYTNKPPGEKSVNQRQDLKKQLEKVKTLPKNTKIFKAYSFTLKKEQLRVSGGKRKPTQNDIMLMPATYVADSLLSGLTKGRGKSKAGQIAAHWTHGFAHSFGTGKVKVSFNFSDIDIYHGHMDEAVKIIIESLTDPLIVASFTNNGILDIEGIIKRYGKALEVTITQLTRKLSQEQITQIIDSVSDHLHNMVKATNSSKQDKGDSKQDADKKADSDSDSDVDMDTKEDKVEALIKNLKDHQKIERQKVDKQNPQPSPPMEDILLYEIRMNPQRESNLYVALAAANGKMYISETVGKQIIWDDVYKELEVTQKPKYTDRLLARCHAADELDYSIVFKGDVKGQEPNRRVRSIFKMLDDRIIPRPVAIVCAYFINAFFRKKFDAKIEDAQKRKKASVSLSSSSSSAAPPSQSNSASYTQSSSSSQTNVSNQSATPQLSGSSSNQANTDDTGPRSMSVDTPVLPSLSRSATHQASSNYVGVKPMTDESPIGSPSATDEENYLGNLEEDNVDEELANLHSVSLSHSTSNSPTLNLNTAPNNAGSRNEDDEEMMNAASANNSFVPISDQSIPDPTNKPTGQYGTGIREYNSGKSVAMDDTEDNEIPDSTKKGRNFPLGIQESEYDSKEEVEYEGVGNEEEQELVELFENLEFDDIFGEDENYCESENLDSDKGDTKRSKDSDSRSKGSDSKHNKENERTGSTSAGIRDENNPLLDGNFKFDIEEFDEDELIDFLSEFIIMSERENYLNINTIFKIDAILKELLLYENSRALYFTNGYDSLQNAGDRQANFGNNFDIKRFMEKYEEITNLSQAFSTILYDLNKMYFMMKSAGKSLDVKTLSENDKFQNTIELLKITIEEIKGYFEFDAKPSPAKGDKKTAADDIPKNQEHQGKTVNVTDYALQFLEVTDAQTAQSAQMQATVQPDLIIMQGPKNQENLSNVASTPANTSNANANSNSNAGNSDGLIPMDTSDGLDSTAGSQTSSEQSSGRSKTSPRSNRNQ